LIAPAAAVYKKVGHFCSDY